MKIIRPLTVLDSMVANLDITEADEAEYLDVTSYASGARVMVTATASPTPVTATHKIYVSQQAANQGNDPTTDDGTWWVEDGSTVAWMWTDNIVQDQSTKTTSFTFDLTPGEVANSVGFINISAKEVTVVVDDVGGDGVVYNQTHSLVDNSIVEDWYSYFFETVIRLKNFTIFDLPPYSGATHTVTVTEDTGVTAKCGKIAFGQFAVLGVSQYGATYSIDDYTLKSEDANGRITITEGNYVDNAVIDVIVDQGRTAAVKRILTDIRATPVVWDAKEDLDGTIIFGFPAEWNAVFTNASTSRVRIEIEGLE